jgi:flagellar operon protein
MTDIQQINNIGSGLSGTTQTSTNKDSSSEISFSELLTKANQVTFSSHAQKRMETREIELGENDLERLNKAVDKAESKGAKESLILMDQLAFIVNVPDRKVVTTINVNQRSEGVFTQIDSVVFAQNDLSA